MDKLGWETSWDVTSLFHHLGLEPCFRCPLGRVVSFECDATSDQCGTYSCGSWWFIVIADTIHAPFEQATNYCLGFAQGGWLQNCAPLTQRYKHLITIYWPMPKSPSTMVFELRWPSQVMGARMLSVSCTNWDGGPPGIKFHGHFDMHILS